MSMNDTKDFLSQIFEFGQTLPNQVALVDDNYELTYRDLKNRVEEAVKQIEEYILGNQCVVLQIPRSIHFPIIILALTKLSITFIPQDISQPDERLRQMINTAKATMLISLDENEQYKFTKINQPEHTPSQAWAIYFTSGSTDVPKAVEIPRENVMNTVIWEKKEFKITSNDHVAAYTPYSFAISYIELFSTLYSGGTIYIASEKVRHDLSLLETFLIDNKITLMNTTAVIGERIIRTMNIPSLRLLTLSGQRFPNIDLSQIPYQIFNVYGNTECGAATISEIRNSSGKITIGKPVYKMSALILGKENQILDAEQVGELFIYGPQVAIGYYQNDDATERTFVTVKIPDSDDEIRGYKTGDFARILSTGEIDYLGRRDRQYKINGVRIDLAEIEEVIQQVVPGIKQTYMAVKENRIYCWVTSDIRKKENDLIKKVSTRVPAVMVPTRIIQIESLPLNGNGKTDEKRLFRDLLVQENIIDDRDISPEQRKAEKYLKNTWAQILNINTENINFESDFKKLGATSLQIMELGVKILQDLNKRTNFVELHLRSNLCDMAQILITEDKFQPIYTFVKRTPSMGNTPALFVVHSGNTGSDVYRPLFENIDEPNFPIYVIEPHNLLSSGKRIDGIENISTYYIDLIENFVPEKNFSQINLMGWSYGGVVASEICYQLSQERSLKSVKELTILDSPFYIDQNDVDLAELREKSGYYRKYFEETHIFEDMNKKNITTEKLVANNHNVFQDLIEYKPKNIITPTTFVRSMVEDKPLKIEQIEKIFNKSRIVDVFSKHDYLFVEQETRDKIKEILHLNFNEVKSI